MCKYIVNHVHIVNITRPFSLSIHIFHLDEEFVKHINFIIIRQKFTYSACMDVCSAHCIMHRIFFVFCWISLGNFIYVIHFIIASNGSRTITLKGILKVKHACNVWYGIILVINTCTTSFKNNLSNQYMYHFIPYEKILHLP